MGVASLLYYCAPIIVMPLSPLLFQEKLTPVKLIGFGMVLCGVYLINNNLSADNASSIGFICGVLAASADGMMLIFNKKATRITGFENAVFQILISFLTVAVFVGFK